ncbi:MAG: superfamily nuclease [Marmoricola sp.]|nr:superfamily nuclease [Marmoricola sp.]
MSWTDDFIEATTAPASLVDASGSATQRANQDLANRQNLLLVLSRGYWSTDFLQAVTQAYWDVDHDQGDNAWIVASLNDATYAPAPNGSYLTDGVVALTAALTANPSASLWAFTEFQPGTTTIDGTDDAIGVFAHYLFFEHRFPGSSELKDDSLGMTATLTALSSAVDAAGQSTNMVDALDGEGPMADSIVLQDLAEEATDDSGGSILMLPWDATKHVAETVWHWTQRWGHPVLAVLSFATVAPFPLKVVGVAAAGTNSAWYAVKGDFTSAGLSLAAVVPALPFGKLAKKVKVVKGAAPAEKAAAKTTAKASAKTNEVAQAASRNKARTVTAAYVKNRPNLRLSTKAKVDADAPRGTDGRAIDPNTQQPIDGKPVYGHKPGYEYRCLAQQALDEQWTVEKFLEVYNDPSHLQLEDKKSNDSHQYESDVCRKVKL